MVRTTGRPAVRSRKDAWESAEARAFVLVESSCPDGGLLRILGERQSGNASDVCSNRHVWLPSELAGGRIFRPGCSERQRPGDCPSGKDAQGSLRGYDQNLTTQARRSDSGRRLPGSRGQQPRRGDAWVCFSRRPETAATVTASIRKVTTSILEVTMSIRQGNFAWLPTVVVLAVVLIAGTRLIDLSAQHHAAVARETAATVANTSVRKIEPLLQKLADLAGRGGASAGRAESVPPAANPFWMTSDDKVLSSRPEEAATASGIASEWQSAESTRTLPGSAVLGPMRLGSRWLIAVRFPIEAHSPAEAPRSRGWSVAYADLNDLIAASQLTRLTGMGYDFELYQVEPGSARSRSFAGSPTEHLTDAVAARIRLPTTAAIPGSYLEVAIRPRAGWYPATLLASEIGLLAFLAWLLAFGIHDLSRALQRSRAALAGPRRRQRPGTQEIPAGMRQPPELPESFDHARFHDAFTGLPNRRYFMDQLDRALRDVRTRRRQRLAVIIVDIVRFKLINDVLGHTAGDELMVQAARRFERSTSAFEGVLARWGGDQFAVLLLDLA